MNSILILKPIIDMLYDDMKEYKDKTEKRIKELEEELASLRIRRKRPMVAQNVVVVEDSDVDDEAFAEAAQAPPTSSLAPVLIQVEKQTENSEKQTLPQEDTKTVKMIGGKDAKEYMKEYQRSYRKKQKDITLNL